MDIKTMTLLFFCISILTGIVIFALSYNLRKSKFFKVVSIVALTLSCIGVILEKVNSFGLPLGMSIIIMSISTIYLTYFEVLNRLFFKINGYYPWNPRDDHFAYSSNKKPDKFINKPLPKKYSTTSNWLYAILLELGWAYTILVLLILSCLSEKNKKTSDVIIDQSTGTSVGKVELDSIDTLEEDYDTVNFYYDFSSHSMSHHSR